MLFTLVIFLLVLSVLVLIHELGHFLVAKKLGIKVEEFGYGFPPRMWSIKKGETTYSINWLPIGGFVKLYGEDEAGAGRIGKTEEVKPSKGLLKRAFFARPAWQRASVVIAGVVMNIALAAVIFYGFFALTGFRVTVPLLKDFNFSSVNQTVVPQGVFISAIEKGSPADTSGMKAFSQVVSINNNKIENTEEFLRVIKQNEGKEISMTLYNTREAKEYQVAVTPRVPQNENQGALGVGISYIPIKTAVLEYQNLGQKLFSGVAFTYDMTVYTLDMFGKLINDAISRQNIAPVANNVSGPIGIFAVVGEATSAPGILEKTMGILFIAGLLSVSLAIMNVLPIPALDGGRLFFIVVEMLTGKKLAQKHEALIHTIGFILLVGLIILITVHDIDRFILK